MILIIASALVYSGSTSAAKLIMISPKDAECSSRLGTASLRQPKHEPVDGAHEFTTRFTVGQVCASCVAGQAEQFKTPFMLATEVEGAAGGATLTKIQGPMDRLTLDDFQAPVVRLIENLLDESFSPERIERALPAEARARRGEASRALRIFRETYGGGEDKRRDHVKYLRDLNTFVDEVRPLYRNGIEVAAWVIEHRDGVIETTVPTSNVTAGAN